MSHPITTLDDLVQTLLQSMQERWNQQLSLDLQENIKACLTTLARNCPADPTSQAKRRALIKSTYQLLIQRVKCGFTFDEATISPGAQLHYLVYDSKKSLNIQNKILLKEFNKRERERERAENTTRTLTHYWWKLLCFTKFTSFWLSS